MMALVNQPYTCQYCNKGFMQEKTLAVHVCEQKRRALAKTEKHVVLGYETYNQFFKLTQNANGNKSYEDFAKSPYYNAFVKFGSFVSNVSPLYPDKFIHYVVTSGVKLDHWCRDELYDKYVVHLVRTENVETALERSIKHMMDWAEEHDSVWTHYFLYASLSRATFDIRDGKISPWLVLNCKTGKDMLKNFNDEQLASVAPIIELQFWLSKFKKHPADIELVKQVVKESNL